MPNSVSNILSIYYQNTRGLYTKTTTFYKNCSSSDYDVICITETWLNSSINNAELFPSSYHTLRCDRNFNSINRSRGGGVLIALSEKIKFSQVDST